MARKKLYGAAAAAHAKKVARGGRGKARRSTAIQRTTRTVHVHHKAKRRRGGKSGGGALKLTHIALATAGLAFATKPGTGFQASVNSFMEKVPGTKTFGATAMLGIGALAIDRFVKPNKWLKLLGTAGIVLAAAQVGSKGADFKFLGDDETGDFDLADDIGDDDIGDDDIGDDE